MKLAAWNVNSVRARHDRLLAFLDRHAPDVVCLQEVKVTEDAFPYDAVRERGYHAAVHGQRTYNGVAVLSRTEPADVVRGFGDGADDDPQARLLWATVDAGAGPVRVCSAYVPNGATVGSDKWAYKLAWLGRLRRALDAHHDPAAPLVVAGDFNVAPDDALDVAKPDRWAGSVLTHPEARAALETVRAWGFEDVVRRLHPGEKGPLTWWDYRALGFVKNDGLRIDHVFATAGLAARAVEAVVDRDERKGEGPSDHAPVLVTFG